MKILIQNYSSNLFSEPYTLYTAMKSIGMDVILWTEGSPSAYDIFDNYKPDVFITKEDFLSRAIFLRLKEENNLGVIVRCANKESEQDILNKIARCNVFSGVTQPCNIFMDNLLEDNENKVKYDIETLYIISKDSDLDKLIVKPKGTYHIISINECEKCDTVMPMGSIYSLTKNYKKVHVLIDACEHVAMDFLILGNETYFNGQIFPASIIPNHTAFDLLFRMFGFPDEVKEQINKIKSEKLSKFLDKFPKTGII